MTITSTGPYALESLPEANATYVASFGDKASLPLPPGKKVAIVGCMDARLNTHAATGLHEGDAHHIRNAGGRVSPDAVRSLVISQELLGTREIIIIHHTDCGMLTFNTPQLHQKLKARPSITPGQHAAVDSFAFLEFSDLEKSVKDDVGFLKEHPLILKETAISGFIYKVETGELVKVA
ncbi:carbonic anhydrase [Gonapodya prolifera JEL478]|uniref:Carbonic anhydrase n=1 Tax=Gonapodya prolifera (strain JEL478) TaxID=1344416 RepID=A0A139B031_GONPJ|nr:carbonic anhydrase [Gonapodya prolifera JEL478]|eukprot:KXS22163.1 carbonic anhydrase [Gonapodya prolifera JEL478]